jgi:hypothetical protein
MFHFFTYDQDTVLGFLNGTLAGLNLALNTTTSGIVLVTILFSF